MDIHIAPPSIGRPPDNRGDALLREAAIELEASFLAEMLKAAGLSDTRADFGGGTGEDQFQSFLVNEQSRMLARRGGIGLAQAIFDSLKARSHAE